MNADDHRHMARALVLAGRGLYSTDPNPRVGCVLVQGGEVVGEGWHGRAGETREETTKNKPKPQKGRKGKAALAAAGIAVESGSMTEAATALNPGFISRMQRGRPWLRLKMAMSLDGRTALANGASRWITGEAARHDVQRWRARSAAILTGIDTVLADDPALVVRLSPDEWAEHGCGGMRQPLRVILDTRLRLPLDTRVLAAPGAVQVFTATEDAEQAAAVRAAGATV